MSKPTKQFPFKAVIFYNAATESEASEVLVDKTVIAPSLEVAKIVAAFDIPEEYRTSQKVAQLEINVNFL